MGNETKRRLATAAAFLVLATAGSRVLGLVREIVMVSYLGIGPEMGAFTVANKVPSLIRTLLADTALSAAFIPVFSALLEKKQRREAWQVAYTVTVLATVILGVVTAVGMVFAPQVVELVAPGQGYDDPYIFDMTVHLMRLMFPTVVIMGIAGIFMGILNSYDHFSMPAIAPIVWNIIIIAVVVVLSAGYGFEALAWGFLIGTVFELIVQIPSVWKRRWRRGLRSVGVASGGYSVYEGGRMSPWRLSLKSPHVRRVGVLIGPVIISLGIVNFNAFVATIVATLISVPAPAIIERAFRLFQLPQGMFAVAIGTVLFPALSRHAAGKRMKEFREDLSLGLRQIFFVTLPFTAFFAVLAVPTIRLIYQHGKVMPADTEQIALGPHVLQRGDGLRQRQHAAEPGLLQHPEAVGATDHRGGQPGPQRRPHDAAVQADGGGWHHAVHFAGEPVQLLRAVLPSQAANRRRGRPAGGVDGREVDRRARPSGGGLVLRLVGSGHGARTGAVGPGDIGGLGLRTGRGGLRGSGVRHADVGGAGSGECGPASAQTAHHRPGARLRGRGQAGLSRAGSRTARRSRIRPGRSFPPRACRGDTVG